MPTRHPADVARGFNDRIQMYPTTRLAYVVFTAVALLQSAPVKQVAAQGPAPIGIRAQSTPPSQHITVDRAAMRRRLSPTGKGAIVGAIVGAGYGYWATRSFERWGSDDGHPVLIPIVLGLMSMGVGALLGYVWGQD